jgi:hypothetical protein
LPRDGDAQGEFARIVAREKEMAKFKVGDRVRPTNMIAEKFKKRGGVIVKAGDEKNYPRILWDGRKKYVYFNPEWLIAENPLDFQNHNWSICLGPRFLRKVQHGSA